MDDNYRSVEDVEKLVEQGRELLRKRRASFNLSIAIHFASFPSQEQEPTFPPYSLPWYVRNNLESLVP